MLFFNGAPIFAQFGFGLNFPIVKDKFYIAPQFDFSSRWAGFYFDMGLMYSRKEIQGFEDKQWLGYFLDAEVFVKFSPRPDITIKTGIGYAFDHLANLDNSLKFHQMPVFITAEYQLPIGLKLFYRLKYPIFKSEDMDMKVINCLGIGMVIK